MSRRYRRGMASEALLEQSMAVWLMTSANGEGYSQLWAAFAEEIEAGTESCLYFIQQGTDGPIKIGIAMAPHRRREELQPGNPRDLVLLDSFPGGRKAERLAHEVFDEFWLRGEWFQPARPILEFIDLLRTIRQEAA